MEGAAQQSCTPDVDLNAKIIDALDRKRERRRRAHTALASVSDADTARSQHGSPSSAPMSSPMAQHELDGSPTANDIVGEIYDKLAYLQEQLSHQQDESPDSSPNSPYTVDALAVQLEQAQQRLATADLRCEQAEQTSQAALGRCAAWEAQVGEVEMERDMLLAELADPPAFSPPSSAEMVKMGPSDLVQLTQKLTQELAGANQKISDFELKGARLATVEGELAALVPLAMRGAGVEPELVLKQRVQAAQQQAQEQQAVMKQLEDQLIDCRQKAETANTDLAAAQVEILRWKGKVKALKSKCGVMSPSESQVLSPASQSPQPPTPLSDPPADTPADAPKTKEAVEVVEEELATIKDAYLAAFGPYDPDGTRTVPVDKLESVMKSIDPSAAAEDIQGLLELAEPVDGRVNYDQILEALLGSLE